MRRIGDPEFLLRLGEALCPLTDPTGMLTVAVRLLGEHLGASRVGYAATQEDGETFVVIAHHTQGVPDLEGQYRFDDCGPALLRECRAGRTVVRGDIANDPSLTGAEKDAHAALQVGAAVDVPLVKAGRLAAVLFVHHREAHAWSPQELAVIHDTAERTWGAVEQALAEVSLHASEDKYRELFNSIDQGFCTLQVRFDKDQRPVDYRFLEVSASFERQTGIPRAAGRWMREIAPDQDAHWFELYGRVALTGEPARFETYSTPLQRWWSVYAYRIQDPRLRRVAVLFNDITERKRAEEELRSRGEQFQTLLDEAPIGVYLLDAQFRIAQVNPVARPVFGDIPDLIGRDFDEVIHILWEKEYADEVVGRMRHTLDTGEPYHTPEREAFRADRGVVEYYEWRINRITLPDGNYGVVCYFSDVSGQVRARQAIARSEARYRTLFESIDEGFCILEVIFDEQQHPIDYRYIEVNPAFERQTGLGNALGRTVRELVPGLEAFWFDIYGNVALTGRPRRFVNHAEPMGRWFDVYAFRVGEPHERKVAVLFTDVTQRKQAEEALREADRHKDEFLAMLAHELRNPLAPIRTSVGILRARGPAGDPLLARCRDVIDRQAAHMTRLLEDLLDVSRLSRGKLTLQRAPAVLQEVLEAAIETSRPLIDQQGHRLTVEAPGSDIILDGDVARLAQVFANLLNNAAKYSDPEGRIDVSMSEAHGRAVVRVRDTGIGIAPGMLDRVFELFAQGSGAPDRAPGGLGIGLSLARRLVEMHGGTITAASAGVGRGSEFTVSLPVSAPVQYAKASTAESHDTRLPGRRVLVADDNVDAADTTALLLEALGCDVRTVHGGEAAVREAETFRPELMLLDLGMPDLDGYEACRRIRGTPWGADMLMVAISGWGQDEDRQRSARAGFDVHLVKPVDPDALLQVIQGLERGA